MDRASSTSDAPDPRAHPDVTLAAIVTTALATGTTPALGIAVESGGASRAVTSGIADARTGATAHEETLFHACSMSKMVTATGVLRLVDAGVLDLDADIGSYLGDWRLDVPVGPPVTLAHLLSHTSGIDDAEGSFEPATDSPPVLDLLRGDTAGHPGPVRATRPPGAFAYSDAGYCVVEHIIETVTGESFASVLDRWVLGPLGLEHTLFWDRPDGAAGTDQAPSGRLGARTLTEAAAGHDSGGATVPAGRAYYPYLAAAGLWSTPTDVARLLTDLLAAADESPAAVLRPATAARMLTAPAATPFAGLGVFLAGSGHGARVISQGWGVGFQCAATATVSTGSVVVAMINADPGTDQEGSIVGRSMEAAAGLLPRAAGR